MQECLEVVAKCGRRKSPEALVCLAEDFGSVRQSVWGLRAFQSTE